MAVMTLAVNMEAVNHAETTEGDSHACASVEKGIRAGKSHW